MKKMLVSIVFIMLLCSTILLPASLSSHKEQNSLSFQSENINKETLMDIPDLIIPQKEPTSVEVPWSSEHMSLLEWWIRITYNGETFEQQVPINLSDFRDRFLKHPEYGEILRFNVDADPEDDVEVIAGIYWSIITDADGKEIASLETRCRSRLLEGGSYLSDADGDFQLWSELHVNYGLIKTQKSNLALSKFSVLYPRLPEKIKTILNSFERVLNALQTTFPEFPWMNPEPIPNDTDSISIGVGYRSKDGEEIPRYIEKRFAFARDQIFSPTLFQHIVDPGSSKGKGSVELLYGFQAFQAGASTPNYDIVFSVDFTPAVYLKTKFRPLQGYVYYYFNQDSQRFDTTTITFSSTILKGSGENVNLSLEFEEIDESLGYSGRWMMFDVDVLGDHNLFGGKFRYEASHAFDVGITLNSDQFEERMKISAFPREVDVSWDLNVQLTLPPNLFAHANGFVDISMSENIGGLTLFYPTIPDLLSESVFVELPDGLPRSTRFEAEASLSLNVNDLQDLGNSMFGRLAHECSENIQRIQVYLPDMSLPVQELDSPILQISEIPSFAEARGRLYWNRLEGNAYIYRSTEGPPDPVEIQLAYGNYTLHDVLEIREGYIDTDFKISEAGYLGIDSSDQIVGNTLTVMNQESKSGLTVAFSEVSADDFRADWDFDTSGERLKINDFSLSGLIDTIQGLQVSLNYQGKQTAVSLDWVLGQTGNFAIVVDQEDDFTLSFDDFGLDSSSMFLGGSVTLAEQISFDMEWKWKQGADDGSGSVDPGSFSINKYSQTPYIKHFDLCFTYQNRYGVNLSFDNLWFYLDFQWWKGDRLLPYVWLDYEVSAQDFDLALLWTNAEGETQWYDHVEDW